MKKTSGTDHASAIAFSHDESRVALGFPDGLVTIHSTDPTTGRPTAELGRFDFLEANVSFLSFRPDGALVAVGENSCWALADGVTGETRQTASGDLATDAIDRGCKGATASLSPDGQALFVAAKVRNQTNLSRVDLATGATFSAHDVSGAGAASEPRVWAIDGSAAWVEMDRDGDGDEPRRQGLLRVDFARGSLTPRLFQTRLWEEHRLRGRPWLLEVDVARGLGVRPRFEAITPLDRRGSRLWPASVELFALDTLEARETLPIAALPDANLEDEGAEGLREAPTSDEHLEAVEALLGQLGAARFDPVRQAVWVSMKYGRLKRVGLGDEPDSELLVHREAAGARDFAALSRRLGSHVLAVSPGGRFVGFGFPNDFLAAPRD